MYKKVKRIFAGDFPGIIFVCGDIVVSHNHAVLKKGEVENIVFDVYRLEDGKLAEHWDCIQHLTPEQIPDAEKFF